MEIDWQFKVALVGLAVAIVFGLLPFAVKAMPHWITWPGIAVGCSFLVWAVFPMETRHAIGPALIIIAGIAFITAGISWYVDTAEDYEGRPNILFQKYALVWVNTEKTTYQLAIIARLFNQDNKSYLIKSLAINDAAGQWIPRGGYYIQRFAVFPEHLDVVVNDDFAANSVKYVAHLLPIIFEMTIEGGDTMDIKLTGDWTLFLDKKALQLKPQFFTTYGPAISPGEWRDLLKPQSQIDIENLDYKPL
jgi:hypothetical protein